MSKQKNRRRRGGRPKSDSYNEQDDNRLGKNDANNINHRAKSVVSTNVNKKITGKKNENDGGQNGRGDKNADRSRQNDNAKSKNRRHRNKKKKNKNSKLKNVRQEDLFQLKDPQRQRRLQNRKKRPRNFAPYVITKPESSVCPICQKAIDNMADTIPDRRTGQAAHFECVHGELMKTLSLKDRQRLSYLGSGVFAVIEDINDDGKTKFRIKEKFEYVK